MVVVGRHAVLSIKGATMADGGHWKLRLENKFGYDEAVIKVSRSSFDLAAINVNDKFFSREQLFSNPCRSHVFVLVFFFLESGSVGFHSTVVKTM